MVVLSDAKHAYDKYNTGKAKTKRFFHRLWEFVWPLARSPTAPSRHCAVVDETDVLVPGSVIPRSVDEALEDYEACKEEMEDVAMRDQKEEVESPSKRRGWFQSAKDRLKGKPILKTEKGPQKSFR